MQRVTIRTPSGNYTVTIGENVLSLSAEMLAGASSVVVVTDENVAGLYGTKACESLNAAGMRVHEWILPAGEESKSLWQAECLYDYLAGKEVDRSGAIVALGGGVVSDLAGFVASTWHRGIRLVDCPTTLLSAIDSAIGGKTGLNHANRKNMIGTFYQPEAVLIDTLTLDTLAREQLSSAMAESIKHGVIADAGFIEWQQEHVEAIFDRDQDILAELIARNVRIKARIVEQDEQDKTGERAKLNFGHTLGHALEAASGYQLTHGQSVALGMIGAFYIAEELGLVDAGATHIVQQLLSRCELPTQLEHEIEFRQAVEILRNDKKSVAGEVRMVLPSKIGEATSGNVVSDKVIERSFNRLRT